MLNNIYKYLNLIETVYSGLRYQNNSNETVSSDFRLFICKIDFNISINTFYAVNSVMDIFSVLVLSEYHNT